MTPKPRLMIVEDELIVAHDVAETLKRFGYEVACIATSAAEAIAKAEETRPDLVLMDIRLHGSEDGTEAALEIRRRLDIPAVFLTAYGDMATVERARESEPLGYLMKPIRHQDLYCTIEIALQRRSLEKQQGQRVMYRMVEELCDGHFMWDLNSERSIFSPSLAGYLQVEEHMNGGFREWLKLVHTEDLASVNLAFDRHLRGESPKFECECRVRVGESWRWAHFLGRQFRTKEGEYDFIAGLCYDTNDRRIAEEALVYLVQHDPVTGVANRPRIIEKLTDKIQQYRIERKPGAVAFIDLEGFKAINDMHGQLVGDSVLREVAERLGHEAHELDALGRWGGSDFVLILDDCHDAELANAMVRRLAALVKEPLKSEPGLILGASVGIVLLREGATALELIDQAYHVMLQRKQMQSYFGVFSDA